MKKKPTRNITNLVAVFFVIFSFNIYADTAVNAIYPKESDFNISITSYGKIRAKEQHDLVAEVSGKIISMHKKVETGSFVANNEEMYVLESSQYKANVSKAKYALNSSLLKLKLEQNRQKVARREWKYLNPAIKRKADKELILRQPQIEAALADYENTKWQLQFRKSLLEKTVIKSPCDGFIEKIVKQKGDYVSVGTKLAKVVCTKKYIAIVATPFYNNKWFKKPYLSQIKTKISTDGFSKKNTIKSHIARVIPSLNKSGFLQIYVKIDSYDVSDIFLLNEIVSVDFEIKHKRKILKIPLKALHGIDFVWISKNNRLKILKVKPIYKDTNYAYLPYAFGKKNKIIVSNIANPIDGLHLTTNILK